MPLSTYPRISSEARVAQPKKKAKSVKAAPAEKATSVA